MLGVWELLLSLGDSILSLKQAKMNCGVFMYRKVRGGCIQLLSVRKESWCLGNTTVSVSALSKIGNLQTHTVIPLRFSDNETPTVPTVSALSCVCVGMGLNFQGV